MNTRTKRYSRWPCELEDDTKDKIRQLATDADESNLEMTRRLLIHAINCPFFDPHVSSRRKVQPPTETA